MTELKVLTAKVDAMAAGGYTRAELFTARALFAQAKGEGTAAPLRAWLKAKHPELLPLFADPRLEAVDKFVPRAPPTVAPAPGPVTPDAAAKVRAGLDDARIQAEHGAYQTPQAFFSALATTPEQKVALKALAAQPQFAKLWRWLETFPGGNPIRFVSAPGLVHDGKERFGGFDRSKGLLLINPSKAEHKKNAMELVDTVVHELLHAASWVHSRAQETGSKIPPMPLPDGVHDLRVDESLDRPLNKSRAQAADQGHSHYLRENYGDGASNPKEEFLDINAGAQDFIVRIIKDVMTRAKVGSPTLTFHNRGK